MKNKMKNEIKEKIEEIVKNDFFDCDPVTLTPRQFFEETGEDTLDSCLAVALLPGWIVRDGWGKRIHYPHAEDRGDAVKMFIDGGNREDDSTQFYSVRVGKLALEFLKDDKGDLIYNELVYDDERYVHKLDPIPPPCLDGEEHKWEEKGVWNYDEMKTIKEICKKCGICHGVDTWDTPDDSGINRREWYEEMNE